MGIFDIFNNDAATEAATKNAALYQGYGATGNGIFNNYGANSNTALTAGMTGATGALDTGIANSTGAVTNGVNTATAAGNNAVGAFAPLGALGQKYGGATGLYLDSLGVNGAAGNDRAVNAFHAGPGYNFQVDQATDAAARNGAKLGIAGSGNTLDAIRAKAQGIADQTYGAYQDRLGGFVNPELQATSGAATGTAGAYKNLSDIGLTGGQVLGGLYSNDAATRAGLFSTDATNRVGVAGNVAQGQNNVAQGVTTGQASANNAQAQAAQNGSATFWNGLFSLGGAAAKAAIPKFGAA